MLGVIYADPYGREMGFVDYCAGDFTIGTSNSFRLQVPADLGIARDWYLMIDGEEYGGIVEGLDVVTTDGHVTAVGLTWHGLLEKALVKPPLGQSHRTATGECNAVLGQLVDLLGLGYCMVADGADSGFSVSGWRYTREAEAMGGYSQARAMLRSVGAKLRIRYDSALRKAVLSAVPRADYTEDGIDGDRAAFSISTRRPVNHLHCMGLGEGADRLTLDLYADAEGRVSRTQTLTGRAHREEAYDNPSADLAELEEYGTQRLAGYQTAREKCTLPREDAGQYDIDDLVGATSTRHGVSVITSVAQKVATVSGSKITYETKTEMEV